MPSEAQWFADYEADAPGDAKWVACIQDSGGCHEISGIWFYSKEDCERWMETTLVGAEVVR